MCEQSVNEPELLNISKEQKGVPIAEKAKASVDKKTRIRDGQRTIAKRLLDQVKQRLNDESGVSDRQWGKESLKAL